MSLIETYTKFKIAAGQFDEFIATMGGIFRSLASCRAEIARADCYASRDNSEAINIMVYNGDRAFFDIHELAHEAGAKLARFCTINAEILGDVSPEVGAYLEPAGVRVHRFAYGIESKPTPLTTIPGQHPIEIYTKFAVKPEKLELFKQLGAEMTSIVKQKDPGTLRYDWFYDDATSHCFALDTYADADSMFAHMKNCHAVHEELLAQAGITAEFLGELPPAALAAVARYSPYILPVVEQIRGRTD